MKNSLTSVKTTPTKNITKDPIITILPDEFNLESDNFCQAQKQWIETESNKLTGFAQDRFIGRLPNLIPLKFIPELTQEVFEESIDWEKVKKSPGFKGVKKTSGESKLANAAGALQENSVITLRQPYEESVIRGGWEIFYDMNNGVYWKTHEELDFLDAEILSDYLMDQGE